MKSYLPRVFSENRKNYRDVNQRTRKTAFHRVVYRAEFSADRSLYVRIKHGTIRPAIIRKHSENTEPSETEIFRRFVRLFDKDLPELSTRRRH